MLCTYWFEGDALHMAKLFACYSTAKVQRGSEQKWDLWKNYWGMMQLITKLKLLLSILFVVKTYQGRAGMTMLSLKPKFMTPIQILKPEIDKLFALMDFHKEVRIHKIFPSMNLMAFCSNWEFSYLYGLPQRSENFQDVPFREFSILLCWTSTKRMMLSRTFIPWKLLDWNLLQQGQAPLPRCQDAKTLCSVTGTFQHLEFVFLECNLLSRSIPRRPSKMLLFHFLLQAIELNLFRFCVMTHDAK